MNGPDAKRRRIDGVAGTEALPPSVRELELKARLSASEKRERELADALEQLSSFLTNSSPSSLLPSADTAIPPSLQPLLHALQSRILSLERENERLRALAQPEEPSRTAQLEAENARLAEMLSSGRTAALEAGLKQTNEAGQQIITALEADCDELLELVKSLRGEVAAAKRESEAAAKKAPSRRSASPPKRSSRRSASPESRRGHDERRSETSTRRDGHADDRRHRDGRSRHDDSHRSRSERHHETRDERPSSREERRKGDERDRQSERRPDAPPRSREERPSAPPPRTRSPSVPVANSAPRGISIRGLANGRHRA